MKKDVKNPMSNELKVATEIYEVTNIKKEKVWFGKLVTLFTQESVNNSISKNTVSNSIDTLFDWGIIKAEYGPTDTGKAARLFMISNEAKPLIKDLYEKYWMDR